MTQDLLLNPSKAKEQTPKLPRAGWGWQFCCFDFKNPKLALLGVPGCSQPSASCPGTCLSAGSAGELCAAGTSPRPCSPGRLGAALALARNQEKAEPRGCPARWRGRQQRPTGAAAAALAGEQILASPSKARGLRGDCGSQRCKGTFVGKPRGEAGRVWECSMAGPSASAPPQPRAG